jgi:hypothetical protein
VVVDARPIGIFDSGVGGLTVARAVFDLLPDEPILYVGDNGRFPYGPRPLEEIRTFALEIAEYLVDRGREAARRGLQLDRGGRDRGRGAGPRGAGGGRDRPRRPCRRSRDAQPPDRPDRHPGHRRERGLRAGDRADRGRRETVFSRLSGLRRARGGRGHLERAVARGRAGVSCAAGRGGDRHPDPGVYPLPDAVGADTGRDGGGRGAGVIGGGDGEGRLRDAPRVVAPGRARPSPRTSSSRPATPPAFRAVAQHFLGPRSAAYTPVEVRAVEGVSWS